MGGWICLGVFGGVYKNSDKCLPLVNSLHSSIDLTAFTSAVIAPTPVDQTQAMSKGWDRLG